MNLSTKVTNTFLNQPKTFQKAKRETFSKVVIDNRHVANVHLIAKNLKKYFSEIGPKIATNIKMSSYADDPKITSVTPLLKLVTTKN